MFKQQKRKQNKQQSLAILNFAQNKYCMLAFLMKRQKEKKKKKKTKKSIKSQNNLNENVVSKVKHIH